MSPLPKEGSRKRVIYEAFHTGGMAAALAKAVELDIKPGTVKSWSGLWNKSATKAPPKPLTIADTSAKPLSKYEPRFAYPSRAAAIVHQQSIMRSSGCREGTFHIIEEGGKFAVVPRAYKPAGPIPQFAKGDWVLDVILSDSRAQVIESGPFQSIVRYVGEGRYTRPGEQCISNVYLIKADAPKGAPAPVKAPKARVRTDDAKGPSKAVSATKAPPAKAKASGKAPTGRKRVSK